jgi:hypothetical protein
MELADFFTVRTPVSWASCPTILSHSALSRIKLCPLRFQLERSEFPEIGRFPPRPNPAALEGAIVHECLESLFKAFSLAGLPQLGSDEALECSREVGLAALIQKKLEEVCQRFKRHPKGIGFSARTSAHQLANRVIRLFRQQYAFINPIAGSRVSSTSSSKNSVPDSSNLTGWLEVSGAITELALRHPQLPFEGIIDLVCRRNGETMIVDYKAGAQDPGHRLQILRYALLWWRCSGQLPARIEIQYVAEKKNEWVTEAVLLQTEKELQDEIEAASSALEYPPAKACLGDHCGYCDIRQFCDSFWAKNFSSLRSRSGYGDIELVVTGNLSDHGFHAATSSGDPVTVTCSLEDGKVQLHGVSGGNRLRMIGVRFDPRSSEVHMNSSSEVWRMNFPNE